MISLLCFQDCNQVYIFWYNPFSFKNDKTLSIWTFSNKSFIVYCVEMSLYGVIKHFTLKENVFDCGGCLACRALWLLFLISWKVVTWSLWWNERHQNNSLIFKIFYFLAGQSQKENVTRRWKKKLGVPHRSNFRFKSPD